MYWRDFGRALGAIVHGVINFVVRSFQDVSTMASRVGVEDMDCSEMRDVFNAVDRIHQEQFMAVENAVMNVFGVDRNDALYGKCRYYTTVSLEVGSAVAGGYGLCKGGVAAFRAARGAMWASSVAVKAIQQGPFCLDKMFKAGLVLDREGLTRAGRALDKHGNRLRSPFPKATGNPASKNAQGQFQLNDILSNPNTRMIRGDKGDIRAFAPDGRGGSCCINAL